MTQAYPLARTLHGIHYRLLEAPLSDQVRFAFTGVFQGSEVIWDTTLLTLTQYHTDQPASLRPTERRAFLEIGNETAHGCAIHVVLDIPHIDEPAILRTIIMVRQYKRLRPGRHVFGEPRTFIPR